MTENTLPAITSPEPEQSSIWDRIDSVPALRAEIRRLEGEVRRARRRGIVPNLTTSTVITED